MFGAKLVPALLGFDFSCALGSDFAAHGSNFRFKPLQRLGNRFEFHRDLSALSTQRLQVAFDGVHLGSKPLRIAIQSGKGLLSLRHLVPCLTDLLQNLRTSTAEGAQAIARAHASGNMAALEVTWTGTHTGPLATAKDWTLSVASVFVEPGAAATSGAAAPPDEA